MSEVTSPSIPTRSEAIDHFRGCATILMVLGNYLLGIENLPTWLQHTPDIGLTITDLGAPAFVFAIGLTYGLSWRRRSEQDGVGAAALHFFTRYTTPDRPGRDHLCRRNHARTWDFVELLGRAAVAGHRRLVDAPIHPLAGPLAGAGRLGAAGRLPGRAGRLRVRRRAERCGTAGCSAPWHGEPCSSWLRPWQICIVTSRAVASGSRG